MDRAEYEKEKEQFSSWAAENKHNVMSSFPRSGRNYISGVLSQVTGKVIVQGINPQEIHHVDFSDVLLFVAHLARWEIRGDKGRYILLIRDPRDAILSRMYHRVAESGESVQDLLNDDALVVHNINVWKDYFRVFLPYEPHVMQYERHCLSPCDSISGILEFLQVDPIEDIMATIRSRDLVNPDPFSLDARVKRDFQSGGERYKAHCLKWQRDPLIPQRFLDIIWTEASELMKRYGYMKDGHRIARFYDPFKSPFYDEFRAAAMR